MRYLSLFDGIGAACVAWGPLGWECVGVSEIEPFPIAVTKFHRPHVPHLGDVTKITEEQIAALGRIDLIVGGFPCTDLSVAGKRAGLRNDDGTVTRSGLFFDAMRIVRVARERCGLRWLLIENVPGLYSSNRGRDFAAVVGEMVGAEFDVPRDGWRNAGFAAGPDGLCEWATLDAQFFNVAQRRVRVFALADFGDWASRPPVLLEPDSLRGDSAPSREAGKDTAGSTGDGVARCLTTGEAKRQDWETCNFVAGVATRGKDQKGLGIGRAGDPMYTLDQGSQHAIAFDTTQITSSTNRSNPKPGDPCHTLAAGAHAPAIAFSCKDHGADAGEVSPTLRSMGHDGSHANGGGQVAVAFAHQAGGTQTTLGYDPELGTAPTLAKCQTPAVHTGMQVRRLTPRECARLQGFPDDYLDITYRGKPAADGPKYRALGNSFAVPVVRWIGERIQQVEDACSSARAAA